MPPHGGVAQLGERVLRMYEVRGSIPLISTMRFHVLMCQIGHRDVIFCVLEKLVFKTANCAGLTSESKICSNSAIYLRKNLGLIHIPFLYI